MLASPPSSSLAQDLAGLARGLMASDPEAARRAAALSIETARRDGDLRAQLAATLVLATMDRDEGRLLLALERLEAVRHLAPDACPPGLDALHLELLVSLGHLTGARLFVASRDGAGDLLTAPLALGAGRLADAGASEDVETLTAAVQAGDALAADRLATLAEVAERTGDLLTARCAERSARALRDEATGCTRRALGWILARAAARRHDAPTAVGWLDELPGGDPARLPEVARLAVAAGDHDLGLRAAAAAERLRERNPGVPLLAALAEQTRALLDSDADALRTSARALRETQRPLLHATAAEQAGVALARAEDLDGAVAAFQLALDAYASAGAGADAERLRRHLSGYGVHRSGHTVGACAWELLTEAELRVVRLVATGATNRSAAEVLFLSPHTVSSHVRHAFEKLGIRSRVELAVLHAERLATISG